jgi:hypothetical protein
VTTVRITYNTGGNWKELIVTLAYLPYDSDKPPPTKEMKDVINHSNRGRQLIIVCDANAHHTSWGITRHQPHKRKPGRISGELEPGHS